MPTQAAIRGVPSRARVGRDKASGMARIVPFRDEKPHFFRTSIPKLPCGGRPDESRQQPIL